MPILRFVAEMSCHSLVETLDLRFAYLIDSLPDVHWIRIIGGPNRRKATPEEKQQASRYLFAAALFVIELEWSAKGRLPKENHPYWQKTNFPKAGLTPLSWEGHVLSLPD